MIFLSFSVMAMYAIFGVPPPVPIPSIRSRETMTPASRTKRQMNSKAATPTSTSKPKTDKEVKLERTPGKPRLAVTEKAKAPPDGRATGLKMKSTMVPEVTTFPVTPRATPVSSNYAKGGVPKSSTSTPFRPGARSMARTSAQERSRLAYQKKIRQLSSRTKNPTVSHSDMKLKPVTRNYLKVESRLMSEQSLGDSGKRATWKDKRSEKLSGCHSSIENCNDSSPLAPKMGFFGRFLGRSFSASNTGTADLSPRTSSASVRKSPKLQPSPRTPRKQGIVSHWRPSGAARSHSQGDAVFNTPVTHLKTGTPSADHKGKKATRGSGSKEERSPPSNKLLGGSTLCHICFYYFISFLAFLSLQMYEAYFGSCVFQHLTQSVRRS